MEVIEKHDLDVLPSNIWSEVKWYLASSQVFNIVS